MIGYPLVEEAGLEIGRPWSKGWKNFGRRWAGGGDLENRKVFMDVIFVSSLINFVENYTLSYRDLKVN